jgi:magnesium transporter
VRRRIKSLKDYISVTSDWISYALIDDITDAFGPLIQGIEYEVDGIDELVLILKEAEQSDMLRRSVERGCMHVGPSLTHACPAGRIGTCRKKVMGLLRLMGNKADVVKGLAKRCNENWSVAPKSDIVSCGSGCTVGTARLSALCNDRVYISRISRCVRSPLSDVPALANQ